MTVATWRAIVVATATLAVALLSWRLVPAVLPARPRHGTRATRRRKALEESTLFRLFDPVLRFFAYYAQRLPLSGYRRKVAQLMVQAGEPLGLCGDEFIGLCALGGMLGATAGILVFGNLGPVAVATLTFIGVYYPNVWLADRSRQRLAQINKGLPYANDLLVLAMDAGADFIGAVRHYVGLKASRDPLIQEFARVLHDLELGSTRRAALQAFAERAPTEPVRGFVAAVVQADQRGTPLAAALRVQSGALRVHRSLLVEKLANRAAVLILIPLLFIFVATVLVLFGGVIVQALKGELFG